MTPCELLVGTSDGVRRLAVGSGGDIHVIGSGVHGNAIRGIAVHPADSDRFLIAAGLRGWGLHRSDDGGETFECVGFEDYWCWDVAYDPAQPDRILVGTEPPMLWESLDAGQSWQGFSSINSVESRASWTFFHPPFHAGHLHGIALSSERPDRVLVGVEHGGLLLSSDRGATWMDVMPGADLHRIEIHPENPDTIYAGTGNGLFTSEDGGLTWTSVEGLRGRYIHGVVIDPVDPQRMFVYVDSKQCPIFRSQDGGQTWDPVGERLPASRPADPIRLHPTDPEALFYAGDQGDHGTLYVSEDNGESWQCTEIELPKVWRLESIP